MLRIMCCGRPCFERLLQLLCSQTEHRKGCGRPCFERLLQLVCNIYIISIVVEDLVLKGYYNVGTKSFLHGIVVEDLVLKGYYNITAMIQFNIKLWKTLF